MFQKSIKMGKPLFGLAEKAQLKMHSVNLARAHNFGSQDQNSKQKLTKALHRAVEILFDKLEVEEDTPLEIIVDRMPLNLCDPIADFLMVEAEPCAKSEQTLPYYYALDLLCGLFRSKVIEEKRPNLRTKTKHYRDSAFHLVAYYLSEGETKGVTPRCEVREEAVEPVSDEKSAFKSSPDELKQVEVNLKQLGYDPTFYGLGVAQLSLESGYSPAETASHLALVTLAMDANEAGNDIERLIALVPHARAMIDVLTELKNADLIREDIFKNDGRAILGVVIVEKDQPAWVERVLSDPVIAKERVATSRINYKDLISDGLQNGS